MISTCGLIVVTCPKRADYLVQSPLTFIGLVAGAGATALGMDSYFSAESLLGIRQSLLQYDLFNTIYNWQWPYVLLAFVLCYTTYYFTVVVRKPKLVCGNGNLRAALEKRLKVVNEYYWPTFWCFSAHLMTVCRVLFKRKPFMPYRR